MEKDAHIPCYSVKIGDEEWVHVPGCYGAIHDPACCTCYTCGSEFEEAIQRRDAAERHVEKLRDAAHERTERLNEMFNRNRKLFLRIQELEAKIE